MLSALQRLQPMAEKVIDRRTSLPILKEICLQDGIARVTDLETMLVMQVPDQGSYCLPVTLLKKVLATRPQDLRIEPGKIQKVTLGYGDLRLSYQGKDPKDFPAIPGGKFKALGKCSQDVFQVLATQTGYCSKDELKGALLGVHVCQSKGQLTTTATDGHVLRHQNGLQGGMEAFEGIIPTKPLLLLSRLSRGHTEVSRSATHLRFALPGDVVMFVRLIDEKYPAVESLIPQEFTGELLLDRDRSLDVIKAARPFASRDTHLAIVEPRTGQMLLMVDNPEEQTRWQAPLPVTHQSGEQMRIGFDLALLEKVLSGQQSPTVRWQTTSPDSASVFTEVGKQWQSGAQTLLMPIRLKEEKTHVQERSHRPIAEA